MKILTRRGVVLGVAVSMAFVSLSGAPAASAATPPAHCSAWAPVWTMNFNDTGANPLVKTALRVRSCTKVVAYTGVYKGKKRAALRITGTAQVWNSTPVGTTLRPLWVSLLSKITDVGVSRESKFYFKKVNPGVTLSYPVTVSTWYVKGRKSTTTADAVSSDSPANWTRTYSTWQH